jgi:hypothetical protein
MDESLVALAERGGVQAKQMLGDNHVAGRRYGQEFGEPFYNGNDNSL